MFQSPCPPEGQLLSPWDGVWVVSPFRLPPLRWQTQGIHQPWNRWSVDPHFFPTKNDSFACFIHQVSEYLKQNGFEMFSEDVCINLRLHNKCLMHPSHSMLGSPKISKSMPLLMPYKKKSGPRNFGASNLWCLWSQGNPWTACRASSCCSSRARAWSRSSRLATFGMFFFSRIIIIESKALGVWGFLLKPKNVELSWQGAS